MDSAVFLGAHVAPTYDVDTYPENGLKNLCPVVTNICLLYYQFGGRSVS